MLNKYFFELKNRFLLILLSWFVTLMTCYSYKKTLFFLLIKVNYLLYMSDVFYFIATNITDVFAVYLQLSYFITTQFVLIFIIYHCLIFISPALYAHEYKNIKFIVWLSLIASSFSIWIFHKIILPFVWFFFLNYQTINVFFEARINDYFYFYSIMYFFFMFINYFFIVIFLFLNFVNNKLYYIQNFRKIFYFSFFFLGTIITPPDVISQIIFGFSCIVVYELIIIIIIIKLFY